MIVIQLPGFRRRIKKLRQSEREVVMSAIEGIVRDPIVGRCKLGDLMGVHVFKFHIGKQQFLLAYRYNDEKQEIRLLQLGPHENFYRDLKRLQ